MAGELKICSRCKQEKDINEFSLRNARPCGRHSWCKNCCNAHNRAYSRKILNSKDLYPRNLCKTTKEKHDRQIIRLSNYHKKYPERVLYDNMRKRSRKQNLSILLESDFRMWYFNQGKQCEYCGISDELALKLLNFRLGVDKIIPENGYVIGNMVLSCARCNWIKGKWLTYDEMKRIGIEIIKPKWVLVEIGI